MSSAPSKSGDDFIAALNLLVHNPFHIRKGCSHSSQNVFQPFDPWTLAGERHFFHHLGREVLAGGLNIAVVENSLDKLTNNFGLIFHGDAVFCPMSKLSCPSSSEWMMRSITAAEEKRQNGRWAHRGASAARRAVRSLNGSRARQPLRSSRHSNTMIIHSSTKTPSADDDPPSIAAKYWNHFRVR